MMMVAEIITIWIVLKIQVWAHHFSSLLPVLGEEFPPRTSSAHHSWSWQPHWWLCWVGSAAFQPSRLGPTWQHYQTGWTVDDADTGRLPRPASTFLTHIPCSSDSSHTHWLMSTTSRCCSAINDPRRQHTLWARRPEGPRVEMKEGNNRRNMTDPWEKSEQNQRNAKRDGRQHLSSLPQGAY